MSETDYSDLKAMYINCTLKRSPEVSNTQGLMDKSIAIMEANGVEVDQIRAIDHQIATGVWARHDRTRLGGRRVAGDLRARDGRRHPRARDGDLARREDVGCHPDHRAPLRQLAPAQRRRQYAYYGRGRRLLRHRQRGRGQALRDEHPLLAPAPRLRDSPQADAGWIGEAGPGPSYLDEGSGGRRTTSRIATRRSRPGTCCTWRGCSRTPAASRPTATTARTGTRAAGPISRIPSTAPESRAGTL